MNELPNNMNHLWATIILEELYRQGVKTICIAPGSRSTPLTWAAAEHSNLETVVHIDERGLGFHALGIAKASESPVAIICTSGSAVANLLPAVVEASMTHQPLILLTADRPPELIDCGANQAIKQPGIFGEYVRYTTNLPCPLTDESPEELLLTLGTAYRHATNTNPGPVHINCPLREPLTPYGDGTNVEAYLASLSDWQETSTPHTSADTSLIQAQDDIELFLGACRATRGLLIVGQIHTAQEWIHVETLAAQLKWPVIADIATPFRLSSTLDHFVAYADQLLHTKYRVLLEEAETIIHIGGALVSKRIQAYIEAQAPKPYFRITPSVVLMDPGHCATQHLIMSSLNFMDFSMIESNIDTDWCSSLVTASNTIGSFFAGHFCSNTLSEPDIIRAVTQTEAPAVFFGNSMPIRDADMYGAPDGYVAKVYANRGASGIDGNIATIAGIAYAEGQITSVLGDLAALHDLNSLTLLRANKVILIIINNAGGGIFSFLPIAKYDKHVEPYFNTPHTLTFDNAAAMYNIAYECPVTLSEFQAAYEEALACGTSTIIEVNTNRDENVRYHRELETKLIDYINGVDT